MQNDPSQSTDIFDIETKTRLLLLSELAKLNDELVSAYQPVTTIEAGFSDEKSFTLPVQDAALSGKIKYSSIHPNQSHTENWIEEGDSILWSLNINTEGTYKAELQYGCPEGETGSKFMLTSNSGSVIFTIDQPFNSEILPDRDYVKRSESVERTWAWMNIGQINLVKGPEKITLKLLEKKDSEAGIIKSVRFIKQ